jgi:hypothetical protein
MRQATAVKKQETSDYDICPTALIGLVESQKKHTIEIDVDALEQAGMWGVAKLEIGGKIYQLFPVIAD